MVKLLDLQDVDAQRRVIEARLNNGLGATVVASYGFNGTAPQAAGVYNNLLQAQQFQLGFQMAVAPWGTTRSATIQAAKADQESATLQGRLSREQAAQDAHFAALQLAQSRRNLDVSAKADTVTLNDLKLHITDM